MRGCARGGRRAPTAPGCQGAETPRDEEAASKKDGNIIAAHRKDANVWEHLVVGREGGKDPGGENLAATSSSSFGTNHVVFAPTVLDGTGRIRRLIASRTDECFVKRQPAEWSPRLARGALVDARRRRCRPLRAECGARRGCRGLDARARVAGNAPRARCASARARMWRRIRARRSARHCETSSAPRTIRRGRTS